MSAIIRYFWVAEYDDGTALPQFDPETGKENMFKEIDMNRLTVFRWLPLSELMALKVVKATGKSFISKAVKCLTKLKFIVPEGKEIDVVRRQSIDYTMTKLNEQKRNIVYVTGYKGGPWTFFDPEKDLVEVSWDFNYI